MNTPTSLPERRAQLLAFLVAATFFMENLDATIITTALPVMAQSFHVQTLDLNLGISAYLLALGVFIPASSWVAKRFGARQVFTFAIAVFTLASLACAQAHSLAFFVAARIVQGIGGAMMVPVGRFVVLQHTPKHRIIEAIATLTWPALIAPVIGPALGGLMLQYVTWPWIFYVNAPLGLIAFILAWRWIPDAAVRTHDAFDWRGFVLSGAGIFCLSLGIELSARALPNWLMMAMLTAAGMALLVMAYVYLSRATRPLLSLETLRTSTFRVSILGGSCFRAAINAVPFLLTLLFQAAFGWSALRAGLILMAVFAGNLIMKTMTTRLVRRFGFKKILSINGAANIVMLLLCMLLSPTLPILAMVLILFVSGMTRSLQFTALSTIAFADIDKDKGADANTLFATLTQLAAGFGITLAALSLRLGHWLAPSWGMGDFGAYRLAFLMLALVVALGMWDTLRLSDEAGVAISQR